MRVNTKTQTVQYTLSELVTHKSAAHTAGSNKSRERQGTYIEMTTENTISSERIGEGIWNNDAIPGSNVVLESW
jgi:hypothetical protein